jgi:hypothetical protein
MRYWLMFFAACLVSFVFEPSFSLAAGGKKPAPSASTASSQIITTTITGVVSAVIFDNSDPIQLLSKAKDDKDNTLEGTGSIYLFIRDDEGENHKVWFIARTTLITKEGERKTFQDARFIAYVSKGTTVKVIAVTAGNKKWAKEVWLL